MSATGTKQAPAYLREARLGAGYTNRDTASMGVPFSPETIGRHERGEIPLSPEDALLYAEAYRRFDIAIRYCTDCSVGRELGKTATDRDFPFATMRLTQRLRRAAREIADTLEAIADDGIVDEVERPVFNAALASLKELGDTIADIFLYAASQGISFNSHIREICDIKRRELPCAKQKQPSTTGNILHPAVLSVKPQFAHAREA